MLQTEEYVRFEQIYTNRSKSLIPLGRLSPEGRRQSNFSRIG